MECPTETVWAQKRVLLLDQLSGSMMDGRSDSPWVPSLGHCSEYTMDIPLAVMTASLTDSNSGHCSELFTDFMYFHVFCSLLFGNRDRNTPFVGASVGSNVGINDGVTVGSNEGKSVK